MTTAWPFDEATKKEVHKQMIKESMLYDLMYEAGLLADGCWDEFDQYDKDAIKKLVELVIKDCIDILEEGSKTQMTSAGGAERIRQHFRFLPRG